MRGRLPITGTFTGTGAAVSIGSVGPSGFRPKAIIAYNETDGTTCWLWVEGMADAAAFQGTNNASTQFSFLTTNGFTVGQGSSVTFGSTISVNTKTIRYIMF